MSDNFSYLIIDEATKIAAVVDPAEPATVLEAIKREGVNCTQVLTTHSHFDHAGGNSVMAKSIPGIAIIGGKGDNAQAVTKEVGEGDVIKIGTIDVQVLYTPCHTPGHVTFVADAKDGTPKCAFTGDTMFVAGCGNLNSGTPAQMYTALVEKIGTLPPETLVYVSLLPPRTPESTHTNTHKHTNTMYSRPRRYAGADRTLQQVGHEYTVKNLMFAVTVEPENVAIQQKLAWAKEQVKPSPQRTAPK
eukprot:2641168-Rhodomonas_salina.1